MKFSNEHYEGLKSAIAASGVDLVESRSRYKDKGLSEVRFFWDLFWASKYNKDESFRSANYKDSHIETAIKKAFYELISS